jgi:drug/metabolite transporter (DMT)-like permease
MQVRSLRSVQARATDAAAGRANSFRGGIGYGSGVAPNGVTRPSATAVASPGAVAVAPDWQVWAALITVYVLWGSTYLGIRVMVESLPPLLACAVRFSLAGAVVLSIIALRGGRARLRISRAQLAGAVLIGFIMLGLGNSGVTMGERDLPAGLTALIMGIIPLVVLLLRRFVGGERVARASMIGVATGLIGLVVLVAPLGLSGQIAPVGLALVMLAASSWAVGAFLSGRITLPADPFVSTGYQLLAGATAALVFGLLDGEAGKVTPSSWSSASLWALVYLVIFGSLIGYSAYTWLLQHAPVSKAATYAYVNPVVAVFLGWLLLGESVTAGMAVGAVLIVASVAFIIRTESKPVHTHAGDADDIELTPLLVEPSGPAV